MHSNLIHVCLSNHMAGSYKPMSPIDKVHKVVYEMYGFNKVQLKLKSNKPDIVHARQACCYLARTCTKIKLITIAQELGKRDHSTIIACIKAMENKMDTDYNNSRDQMNLMIKNLRFSL